MTGHTPNHQTMIVYPNITAKPYLCLCPYILMCLCAYVLIMLFPSMTGLGWYFYKSQRMIYQRWQDADILQAIKYHPKDQVIVTPVAIRNPAQSVSVFTNDASSNTAKSPVARLRLAPSNTALEKSLPISHA